MGLLPKNEPKEKDITPTKFFIWGQTMSGKTYLARKLPNPVILNTDSNAKKVTTPSIDIKDFEMFLDVIEEIVAGKHTYETIIIDLVDDINVMLKTYVCEKYEVDDEGEVPYGKGYREVKSMWQNLMVRLSKLKYNVVFISHIAEINENGTIIEKPSLEQKFYNMTMGRCDLSIKCRKAGKNYLQMVDAKRDNYTLEDIKDDNVREILKSVTGVFGKEPAGDSTVKKIISATPVKKVEAVVNKEDKIVATKTVKNDDVVATNTEIEEPTPVEEE